MNNSQVKIDLLSQLLHEAQAYRSFSDIEKLVEAGSDLSMIPIQPLYISLQNVSKDEVALILSKLSAQQRQALRDIDLWKRDELDPTAISYWFEVYGKCPDDEVVLEFIKSEDFLLGLKNQFTVATFDTEDPQYPDHDNYFLTEDNLLLIEYPEDFHLVGELKQMIRRLYGDLGVENAYAFLFKMVVDSYQIMEEAIYEEKKERLRDFGFVDYYEALAFNSTFNSLSQIEDFILSKKVITPELDGLSQNQSIHSQSLTPYQQGMDSIKSDLAQIQDEKRAHFLHFNFVRLVNARMTLEDALKNGSMAMARVGKQTRQCLELGFDFAATLLPKGSLVFLKLDFLDIYKIGHSLITIVRKKIKKSLESTPFEKDDFSYFLGLYWNSFLENSFEEVAKYKFDGSSMPLEISNVESYQLWREAADNFTSGVPFIEKFFSGLEKLKSQGLLNDQFYLNYEVDNIDFEAIMISSFINFVGGHYQESSAGKMGVTVNELKNFYRRFFFKRGDEYLIKGEEDPILREHTLKFIEKFGLTRMDNFHKYLYQIMLEQLNGYEVDVMSEEDFKHVGGPILLNKMSN
jgi:hypothetical protein